MTTSGPKLDRNLLRAFLQDCFKSDITNLRNVKYKVPTEVWSFKVENKRYFIKISYTNKSFFQEQWALNKTSSIGVHVPKVVLFDDFNKDISHPLIILEEITGTSLIRTNNLSISEEESIIFDAGIDLAKINSIKTKDFGWCSLEKSIKNKIVTGYDSSSLIGINIAVNESLPYLLGHNILNDDIVNKLSEYFRSKEVNYDIDQGHLTHGDFNGYHIFVKDDVYSGIIDFGGVMSMDPYWDIAYFSVFNNIHLTNKLIDGWKSYIRKEVDEINIEPDYIQDRINFYSLLICVSKTAWIMENYHHKDHMFLDCLYKMIKEKLS